MRSFASLLVALVFVGASSLARAQPPSEPVEAILCRGDSAVGFSYAWGGECWCADGCRPDLDRCSPGSCTPNPGSTGCPNCTHSGTYGADCSGFVSRAWQVPRALAVDACGTARYVASDFTADHVYWDVVSVNALEPADAAATSSHVVMVTGGRDTSGEYPVVEAMGCVYGIVYNTRVLSIFHGARRINLEACTCDASDVETQGCGDCGTQERTCHDGCTWSDWSTCDGPDPAGGEEPCTVPGATGACAEGRMLCVAGWLTCQSPSATSEICDGLDNDCDGVVDNGTPESLGEGYACTNDCGAGVSQCIEGALRCVTPGSTWPDESCGGDLIIDGGLYDDDGGGVSDAWVTGEVYGLTGGCACGVSADERDVSLVEALVLLGVLAILRRVRSRPT